MKFSSLAALEVVTLGTSSVASDEYLVERMTFGFDLLCLVTQDTVDIVHMK